jgi:hypothetical protein
MTFRFQIFIKHLFLEGAEIYNLCKTREKMCIAERAICVREDIFFARLARGYVENSDAMSGNYRCMVEVA